MKSEGKIFVYVQAIPESVPSRARNFVDLSETTTTFRMNHSSKVALERAKNSSADIVVALGHSSVLREALARGADEVVELPLCDDPLVQAQSIKEKVSENMHSSVFFVGENPDGPFSGSSLCGSLSAFFDLNLEFDLKDEQMKSLLNGTVALVRDDGTKASHMDIRRLGMVNSKLFPQSQIIGTTSMERKEFIKNPETISDRPPKEIASIISRRLRRFAV